MDTLSPSGICMRRKDQFDRDALHFAPFCLFPSPFPRDEYENAIKLQPVINELMHKVAHDYNFLKESLKLTIEVDDFTGKLWQIYQTIMDEGGPTQVSAAVCRHAHSSGCSPRPLAPPSRDH